MTGQISKIVIIGAGRLASHLGLAFFNQGLKIIQVCNRSPENGKRLADRVGASFTDDIGGIISHADLYMLAVSDSVLAELASRLYLKDRLVVHASGTMDMAVLSPISANIGVFYPVQTFSQNRRIDFRKIPICIEGNSKATEQQLADLAKKLTQKVHYLGSEKRQVLHLGAVFAANFTNFMYSVTEELLRYHEIPLSLLGPLVLQTARNIEQGNLFQCQTGPAVRGDIKVLEMHRELLSDHPDYLEIYNLITKNIIKYKSLHGKL
jgi:predicted short-subunit dehydrogenase-like oxidoreductase (DUF2520 family)